MNIIQQKSFSFAKKIVKLSRELNRKEINPLVSQLLRSGTSIGANIEEAIGSQSKKEFFTKVSIAYKEARETRYWIKLLKESDLIRGDDLEKEIEELCKILGKIIHTTKTRL